MSTETYCSFCETLPTTAPGSWGGRASKCPVCRAELWTASGGATYRLGAAPVASRGKRHWLIGVSLLAVVGLIVGCYVAFKPREVENPTGPVAPIQARSEPAAKVDGPIVQAKWAWPAYDAQAKPLPPRVKATPTPPVVAQAAPPINKPPVVINVPIVERPMVTLGESLQGQLAKVPQVDLDPDYLKKSKSEIAALAREIIDVTKKDKDAFVRQLMTERQDMAGMPFLLGKDCTISGMQSKALASSATLTRMALSEALKPSRFTYSKYEKPNKNEASERFWSTVDTYSDYRARKSEPIKSETIPALRQILLVENQELRLSLVNRFKDVKDAQATDLLANRAVFDLEPDIRRAAIELLRTRPAAEYRPALEKALRYPWRPVVRHAAEALVALDMQEMLPHLKSLLNEPAPESPVAVKDKDGVQKTMVRELVRVNHHRNCMLCHAPMELSGDNPRISRDLPVGPAPSAQEPLPPSSSSVYYSPRNGVTIVRADITYLRQDFSLQQHVDDKGNWDHVQRFDFLVRTRTATQHDAAQAATNVREYRQVIAEALAGLAANRVVTTARALRW